MNKPITKNRDQSHGKVSVQMSETVENTVFTKWNDNDSIMYIRVINGLGTDFVCETKITDASDIRKTIEDMLGRTEEVSLPKKQFLGSGKNF